ncbi:uncharacterized protein METZ01_LOCUS214358 [marine metagenome]|uniref:Uncharacterized protein n=1 Tax=marine metagenome TaxID=408172 RepID=A0A382FGQ5_9ZZZZ
MSNHIPDPDTYKLSCEDLIEGTVGNATVYLSDHETCAPVFDEEMEMGLCSRSRLAYS